MRNWNFTQSIFSHFGNDECRSINFGKVNNKDFVAPISEKLRREQGIR